MTSCLRVGLFCLVVVVEGVPYDVPTCSGGQFLDGTQCRPCPSCGPGYGLSEICGNGQGVNAVCEICPEGYFSDDDSMEMCRSCRICSDTMEDAVPCTPTSDRKCGNCRCGYFRYEQRRDHCARCADENNRHNYNECLPPVLPCPTPTTTIQEPVTTVTTEEPSKRPTSLNPVFIGLIVLAGLVLTVILVVVCLCREDKLKPHSSPSVAYETVVTESIRVTDQPGKQETASTVCRNITAAASCDDLAPVTDQPAASNECPNMIVDLQCGSNITAADGDNDRPEGTEERRQGATPFDGGSGSINSFEDHSRNSDTALEDYNSNAESHSQGSRHSGTQTDLLQLTNPEGDQKAEFDNRLKEAVEATKGIKLDSIHGDDVILLNLKLHERSELLKRSFRFHYGRLAKLFGFTADDIRGFENAEQVLSFVAARRKEQYTVANLLEKLAQSGKCFDVVRELVEQILERQQH